MVNSLGGILSTALGTWNKNRGRFPSRKNPNPSTNAEYEKLEEYDYPAVGCDCQLVMSRANGGLVFYEKVDKDGDIMVHNVIAHNARPTDKDADDLSLSVAQKIKALEKYGKVCRLCKLLHISTKNKYLKNCWQNKVMTQSELLELLGILEESPQSIPDTDNFFVNSPVFVHFANT